MLFENNHIRKFSTTVFFLTQIYKVNTVSTASHSNNTLSKDGYTSTEMTVSVVRFEN